MPRPTRWPACVNGLKARGRACFICPPIRLTSIPSKWPGPKLSSSCAKLKRAPWKHSTRRLLRPYKLFLRTMLKASSSMSDFVYDPYGNRYMHSATASVSFVTHLGFGPQCRAAFDSYVREVEGDAYCAGFVDHTREKYSWTRFGEDLLRGALARQWGYITRAKLPKAQVDLFGLQTTYTLRADVIEDGKKKGIYIEKHWRLATLGDIRRHIEIAI